MVESTAGENERGVVRMLNSRKGGAKLRLAAVIVGFAEVLLHTVFYARGSFNELANNGSPASIEALQSCHERSRTLLVSKP